MKSLSNIDWTFKGEISDAIHSIHPYPAKFIQEIPSTLLNNLPIPKESYVLDPFCGSGVSLVECQKRGIPSVGIDLNPIAVLISKAKTEPLGEGFLPLARSIIEQCRRHEITPLVCSFNNIKHWFKDEISIALGEIKGGIEQHRDSPYFSALQFCFSSIIVRVSNQESDTRYAYKDKAYTREDVFKFFLQKADKLHKVKNNYDTPSEIIMGNSLVAVDSIPSGIGMVITSPPYPCAYEYWLYHKFRMYWLGYDPQGVKAEEIGTRSLYFKSRNEQEYDFSEQMREMLQKLYAKCKENAYLCFIIGRSKIHGKIYKNDEIIEQIAQSIGYRHITTIRREIDSSRKSFNLSHARIKEEYIVVLQR
ncbi:MAG: site-specific DNA-methyltransferase [Bacteroidales bacterium]|nr:site-specific DNA-methyltransferase [Bacteroidales bacterium]